MWCSRGTLQLAPPCSPKFPMSAPDFTTPASLADFVWGIADQLRGVYKPNQYGMVVLSPTILRRVEKLMPHWETMRELAKTARRPPCLA